MSDFGHRLESLLDRVPGAVAVSLVAGDGIPVKSVVRDDSVDLEVLAAELLTQVSAIADDQRDLGVGAVRHYAITTERYTIMIGAVQPGFYLLLVLTADGGQGRARFELRRAALTFEEDLV